MDNLLGTVLNLFSAGTDTTSSTLRFGLLLMAKYPDIQGGTQTSASARRAGSFWPFAPPDKVQEELDSVVGSRQIQVEDRRSLPYTDAVIHEVQRKANIVPTIQRCTRKDVTFKGHFIKKVQTVPYLCSHQMMKMWMSSILSFVLFTVLGLSCHAENTHLTVFENVSRPLRYHNKLWSCFLHLHISGNRRSSPADICSSGWRSVGGSTRVQSGSFPRQRRGV